MQYDACHVKQLLSIEGCTKYAVFIEQDDSTGNLCLVFDAIEMLALVEHKGETPIFGVLLSRGAWRFAELDPAYCGTIRGSYFDRVQTNPRQFLDDDDIPAHLRERYFKQYPLQQDTDSA